MAKKSDSIILIIMVTFLSLSLGTRIHDPVLHGGFALLQGWDIATYEAYLTTGSTTAQLNSASALEATTGKLWWFYMFPSLFLFFASWFINIFYPDKLTRVIGAVVMGINLGSLEPVNFGGDAYKALAVLTKENWELVVEPTILMWAIMIVAVIMYGAYMFVVIENSNKDAKGRMIRLKRIFLK